MTHTDKAKSMRKVIRFINQYPNDWIEQVWGADTHIGQHLKSKWTGYAKSGDSSYEAVMKMLTALDAENEKMLMEWIDKKFANGGSMATGGEIKFGQIYHIDTDRISQYIGTRIVDDVKVVATPLKTDKRVLVYSPYLMANVFVPKSELKKSSGGSMATGETVDIGAVKSYLYNLKEKDLIKIAEEYLGEEDISYEYATQWADGLSKSEAKDIWEQMQGGSMATGGEVGDSYGQKLSKRAKEINSAVKKGEALFYSGSEFPTLNNTITNVLVTKEYGMDEAYVVTKEGKKFNAGSTIFSNVYDEKGLKFGKSYEEYSFGGSMATGGGVGDRMYNFLKDDLKELEKAVSEGNNEEVERFFSYWGYHLKSLKTKTNDRMYNFLKDDLEKLEKAVSEGNNEEVERFFSYWGYHLKSLKMAQGGSMANGGSIDIDFWISQFRPRSEEWREKTLARLKEKVSLFETAEENAVKIQALEYIESNPEDDSMDNGGETGKGKKKEITVYSFDELSESAKEKAIEDYRSKMYEWGQDIVEQAIDDDYLFEPKHDELVKMFGKDFYEKMNAGKKYKDEPMIGNKRKKVYFDTDRNRHLDADEAIEINSDKYFLLWLGIPEEMHDKVAYIIKDDGHRYADTIIEFEPYESDYEFADAENKILENAADKFKDHMDDVLRDIEKSIEYRYSDEAVEEEIKANELEFLEDGRRPRYVKGGTLRREDFVKGKKYKNTHDGKIYTFKGKYEFGGRAVFVGSDGLKRIFSSNKMVEQKFMGGLLVGTVAGAALGFMAKKWMQKGKYPSQIRISDDEKNAYYYDDIKNTWREMTPYDARAVVAHVSYDLLGTGGGYKYFGAKLAKGGKAGGNGKFVNMSKVSKRIASTTPHKQEGVIIGVTNDGDVYHVEINNNRNYWSGKPEPTRGFSMSGTTSTPYSYEGAKEYAEQVWIDLFEGQPEEIEAMANKFGETFDGAEEAAQFVLDTDGELHGFDQDHKLDSVDYKGEEWIFNHVGGGQNDYNMLEKNLSRIYVDKATLTELRDLWKKYHLKQLPKGTTIPIIEQDKDAILRDALSFIQEGRMGKGGATSGGKTSGIGWIITGTWI